MSAADGGVNLRDGEIHGEGACKETLCNGNTVRHKAGYTHRRQDV